jgi:hypothetical protein
MMNVTHTQKCIKMKKRNGIVSIIKETEDKMYISYKEFYNRLIHNFIHFKCFSQQYCSGRYIKQITW